MARVLHHPAYCVVRVMKVLNERSFSNMSSIWPLHCQPRQVRGPSADDLVTMQLQQPLLIIPTFWEGIVPEPRPLVSPSVRELVPTPGGPHRHGTHVRLPFKVMCVPGVPWLVCTLPHPVRSTHTGPVELRFVTVFYLFIHWNRR